MLYEDNTEKEVCGYEISGFDNMKVEPQTVTVIYKVHDNLCYNYKKLRGESMKVNYNSTIRSCFIGYSSSDSKQFCTAVVYYVSIAIQYTAVEDNIINYNQLWFTAYNRFCVGIFYR